MAKKRPTRTNSDIFNSDLPAMDQAKQTINQIKTGTTQKNSSRQKYTTALNPTLIEKLKVLAIKKKCKPADLLEQALKDFLERADV